MINRVTILVLLAAFFFVGCSPRQGPQPGPTTGPATATAIETVSIPTDSPAPALPTETSLSQPVPETAPSPTASPLLPLIAGTNQATTDIRYRMQIGAPVAVANFIAPEAGCSWLGVGGQAFDLNGTPVANLVVEIGGTLEGGDVFHLGLTGSSTLLGPGGFVITLSNHAVDSAGTLWILIYDLAGIPLSEKLVFPTYSDCTKNFTIVNLVEVTEAFNRLLILPLIFR